MTTGVVLGMDEAEYHSHPALSASQVKLILDSPARFKHEYIDGNRVEKKAWDVGTAVHTKVLGTGADAIAYPDRVLASDGSVRAKAKEWALAQRAAGLVPLKQHDLDLVNNMAEAVLANDVARKLAEREGNAEASVFAESHGLELRCRFDYLPDEGSIAVDLKTTSGLASKEGFARDAAKYRYHVQRGHYIDVLERATGRVVEMVFVVVETKAPHLVGVHQLSREFAEMGQTEALAARDTYRRCLETGEWPGYDPTINLVSPPMWAVYEHEDRFGEHP